MTAPKAGKRIATATTASASAMRSMVRKTALRDSWADVGFESGWEDAITSERDCLWEGEDGASRVGEIIGIGAGSMPSMISIVMLSCNKHALEPTNEQDISRISKKRHRNPVLIPAAFRPDS